VKGHANVSKPKCWKQNKTRKRQAAKREDALPFLNQIDTNIVSELRKNKPHGGFTAWSDSTPVDAIQIPAVVIGELQAGVEKTRLQDPLKATEIERWIDRIMRTWMVLGMEGPSFREWSHLMAQTSDDLTADAMIAATARIHRLVVTRDVRDFEQFGVQVFDPFTGNPKAQRTLRSHLPNRRLHLNH
jgi:toxin FitB